MPTRNKQAGNKWELDIVHDLIEHGYDAVTSRQESRSADARGIDIISKRFPLPIQCKACVNQPNFHNLLTETDASLVVYRKMEKRGSRFYKLADYAVLPWKDLLTIIDLAYGGDK
jgi:hypothetical protein